MYTVVKGVYNTTSWVHVTMTVCLGGAKMQSEHAS
jgi:hypothetical protein